MRETEGLVKATESSGTFGTARLAKRPISWSMTARAAPQRPSDFESVLLAIAGHDLRQPLQVIQHELLGLGVRTESELRLLRSGQSAIDRLRDQLDQLLAALRLRDHAEGVKLTPVPVEPLFREVCHENEIAALRKGVRIRMVETTLPRFTATHCFSAPSCAMWLATLSNTRNLVAAFLLVCRHVGQSIRIEVYDTGIGIAGDQMPQIFEAFTPLDPARRDSLGVCLFIVRRAVAMLEHRVDITSALEHGSRFSIFATKAEEIALQPRQAGRFPKTTSGAQS